MLISHFTVLHNSQIKVIDALSWETTSPLFFNFYTMEFIFKRIVSKRNIFFLLKKDPLLEMTVPMERKQ